MMHFFKKVRYFKSLIILIIFCTLLHFCVIITYCFNRSEQLSIASNAPVFAQRQAKSRSNVQAVFDYYISFIFKYLFNVLSLRIFLREDEYYTLHSREVTNIAFPFIDNGSRVCSELAVAPVAVLIILSTWEYRAKRDAIRRTWLSGNYTCLVHKLSNVNESQAFIGGTGDSWPHVARHAFLFGVPENVTLRRSALEVLERESREHHDIVIADFWDTHPNLTLKVLSGLRWAVNFCSEAQYVIKTDHDVFIHVPRLIDTITRPGYQNAIVGGYTSGKGNTVYRDGRYKIPYEAYPFDFGFPEHVKGGVYSMNLDIARSILQVAPFMPYIGVEDLHITGILRRVAGVQVKGFQVGMYRDWVRRINKEIRHYLHGNRIASHLSRGHSTLKRLWHGMQLNSVC